MSSRALFYGYLQVLTKSLTKSTKSELFSCVIAEIIRLLTVRIVKSLILRGDTKSISPNTLLLLAGTTRLELATSGVTGRRSNQTELRPQKKVCWVFRVC